MDQYRLYRRPDGKWYEPVLATQDQDYATDWAIRYSAESPRNVTHTVWRQPFETHPNFNRVRKPTGEQVSAEHRGRK